MTSSKLDSQYPIPVEMQKIPKTTPFMCSGDWEYENSSPAFESKIRFRLDFPDFFSRRVCCREFWVIEAKELLLEFLSVWAQSLQDGRDFRG